MKIKYFQDTDTLHMSCAKPPWLKPLILTRTHCSILTHKGMSAVFHRACSQARRHSSFMSRLLPSPYLNAHCLASLGE